MAAEKVLVSGRGDTLRFVTNFDFKAAQIDAVAQAFRRVLQSAA
jgi:threonine aldolase